ncbi:MAG: sensor histidine kinase [Oscillospiraceae bacterium]
MTELLCIIAAAVCIIAAAIIIIIYRLRTAKVMRSLDKMIDKAIDGSFTEENIDETMLSSVEAKLARYLSASELSARNVASEKEKIKELISDISHQTKTPVANIMLYADLLSEQDINEQARSCAESIGEQAEKLSFLIAALVKLSRLETGVIALSPVRKDIAPMLENVYKQYLPKAEEKGIKLTLEHTSASALYDEKWCAEAIGNIVDNAVKYTDSGFVSISVMEYEMFCAVIISDSGQGISEEEQGRIFTRFYRSPSVSQKDGLGIGLYLAREIISGCGGYIKVSSEVGRGTAFSVYLRR